LRKSPDIPSAEPTTTPSASSAMALTCSMVLTRRRTDGDGSLSPP
jgi:hypothetical protein